MKTVAVQIKKQKKQNRESQLGKAIINTLNKKKFIPKTNANPKFIHLENNIDLLEKQQNLCSVIDQDNLEEFLHIAELRE